MYVLPASMCPWCAARADGPDGVEVQAARSVGQEEVPQPSRGGGAGSLFRGAGGGSAARLQEAAVRSVTYGTASCSGSKLLSSVFIKPKSLNVCGFCPVCVRYVEIHKYLFASLLEIVLVNSVQAGTGFASR